MMFQLGLSSRFSSTRRDVKSLVYLNDYLHFVLDEINQGSIYEGEFEPICHRLNLAENEKLLDIGGELAIYAAGKYAAKVFGVTLNKPLHMKLNHCIAAYGLLGSAVKYMDYRNLVGVRFDKAVCLDPFAKVNRKTTVTLLGTIYNVLRPGGLFLTPGITSAQTSAFDSVRRQPRLAQYIGSLFHASIRNGFLTVNQLELIAHQIGFEIHLAENLSETYRIRLQGWLTFLRLNRDEVVNRFSEDLFQHWIAEISILLDGIERGDIQFHQYLFSKPGNSHNRVLLPDAQRCCVPRNSE